ncbi:SusC/RagA family TonB-linked outer membrane protein [Moheibacter lacus]|uniref:SusC/RagA family TonB-linked outer membrane protein n=1 Tax=Moheibacter lacus TaxID=2745851 RepID=A0A838ZTL6_9FLAO|nr:SusC/RagA family TonB-linked outer membrane protein [Moheibacter lacus]MBA5630330.1 SusC/RagA family TonB-linked outer membrane protein [Moheibacter lacus]
MKIKLLNGKGIVPRHLLIVLMTLCSLASAQQPPKIITGTVYDAGGPIPGVSVLVKGTNLATVTNEDGTYAISTTESDTLVFTYPDYEPVEAVVGNQTAINIEMYEAVALQEAVINAGYYTVKDKERTGSIYRVSAEEIERQPVNNILESLQGRVPGLDIVQTTGLAGGGYTVRIRGQNSISAGNEPLYVIDGVPYDTGTLSDRQTSGSVLPDAQINPLNTLDPSSIESIEILKDADATAIYGSRGANGVILITTKKGKSGKTEFSVNASTSVLRLIKFQKLLNTQEYLSVREQAFLNDGYSEYPATAYDVNGTWDRDRYTDWQKEFLGGTAFINTLNTAVSGGSEQTFFKIGNSIRKETTVFPGHYNYKNLAFYASVSHRSKNDKLHLQFTGNFGQDQNYLPATDLTWISTYLPPNAPALYDSEGNLNWEDSTWENPLAAMESEYRNKSNNLSANARIQYELFKALSISSSFGYTHADLQETRTSPHTMFNPAWGYDSSFSSIFDNRGQRDSWIIEPQINSSFQLGKGKFDFLVGGTLQKQNSERLSILGANFISNEFIRDLGAASEINILTDQTAQYNYIAFYARLNYNLNQKYILNLSGRRDGSSRFGPDNRFSNFGAVGAAWIFSKEHFFQDLRWLNFAKLRASYGITGNDQIGDYQYLNTYSIGSANYDGNIALSPTRLYNPSYAWEKNRKFEVALESELFSNRVRFEINYYNNTSDNQLLEIPLPVTTGFAGINSNLDATVRNSGWEFMLTTRNIQNKNFNWSTSFQFTLPKNKLISFEGLENSTYINSLEIGYPIGIYKLYELTGINQETGFYDFRDYDGDGEISSLGDQQYIADLNPKFYGGIENNFQYKNLKLNFFLQFMKKDNFNEFYGTEPPGLMRNQPAGILNQNPIQPYTTGENYDAYFAHYLFSISNAAVSDASFIRLKSLNIAYSIPTQKETAYKLTLFAQGYNLLTLTRFKGRDPEQNPGFLAPLRQFTFGFKLEL